MLLAVDIGNTNIVIGLFRDAELKKQWKIRADRDKTCDEYEVTLTHLFNLSGIEVSTIQAAILSSVVPPLTPVFQKLILKFSLKKPLVVGPGLKTGMPILYENPLEVGADRIVGSIAAFTKYGGPAIIVDFGTATTFDVVSEKGEYLGEAIAPGVQIAAEALYLKTAKLPRIEIRKPKRAIGRTTVTSMQSGLFYGYLGLVSTIIAKIKTELGKEANVVATGGFADLMFSEIDSIQYHEPCLILEGLRILFEKNKD